MLRSSSRNGDLRSFIEFEFNDRFEDTNQNAKRAAFDLEVHL